MDIIISKLGLVYIKIKELHDMISKLLRAKRNIKELRIHWIKFFLKHHPTLKSKFVSGLEKARVATEDLAIIKAWFELVEYHIQKNAV